MIDDEIAITESLGYSLKGAGFRTISASTLGEATQALSEHQECVSLVILDLSLPDGHGFDWLKQLRVTSTLPVIILSSHDDEIEHIVGLEIGADDFIDKPFSPREVVARVRALLRRAGIARAHLSRDDQLSTPQGSSDLSAAEGTWIDYDRCQIFCHGVSLGVSQQEFSLFDALWRGAGKVFTRASLLRVAWGGGVSVSERTVDVHITSLRRKWSEHHQGDMIETIRGVGYRLSDQAPEIHARGVKQS